MDSQTHLIDGRPPDGIRVAMWSGPRNISTALLRSWGSRPDTYVCDEPLYAHYLSATDVDHPGRDEVLERHERDWPTVVDWLTGPVPEGKAIFYQKHMAHHLLADMDTAWVAALRNALLIRNPGEMLVSLTKVTPNASIRDTGLPQQWDLYRKLRNAPGDAPPVIDARDVLENPAAMLSKLCDRLGVPFTDAMLSWDPGPRATDGVWAKHWYAAVERSTGFAPPRAETVSVPPEMRELHEECLEYYLRLHEHRIRV